MISVLIPLYNRDINQLVQELGTQAGRIAGKFEICIIDDGSENTYQALNRTLSDIPLVRYVVSGKNNGRVRVRQQLMEMAVYDWLLFIDCDSRLIAEDYLERYYKETEGTADVISGGRVYATVKPGNCLLRLHWKYGTTRERMSLKPQSVKRFMTNNFLIRKSVFQRLAFPNTLQGYGYEDTWMGIQLEEMKASLRYLHNPVLHEGIETASAFIQKSENAMRNLHALRTIIPHHILSKHVRLFQYYNFLKKYGLLWLVKTIYFLNRRRIMNNLHSCNPSLLLFDIYRLHYFIRTRAQFR